MKWKIIVIALIVCVLMVASEGVAADSPLPTPTPPGGEEGGGFDWGEFLEWVLENKDQIIELVLLVLALVMSWINRGQAAKSYGIELMREAEELARKRVIETGSERMEYVVSTLIEKLPVDVKAVLRLVARLKGTTFEEMVADLAQRWFDKVAGSS